MPVHQTQKTKMHPAIFWSGIAGAVMLVGSALSLLVKIEKKETTQVSITVNGEKTTVRIEDINGEKGTPWIIGVEVAAISNPKTRDGKTLQAFMVQAKYDVPIGDGTTLVLRQNFENAVNPAVKKFTAGVDTKGSADVLETTLRHACYTASAAMPSTTDGLKTANPYDIQCGFIAPNGRQVSVKI